MLINPGYAFVKGEQQVAYAGRKILALREMIEKRGLDTKIELDGRVSPKNIEDWGAGAADIFVTGSTCLKRDDLPGSFAKLEALRAQVLK
jgi:ribulose-phosphate 3-epimerase